MARPQMYSPEPVCIDISDIRFSGFDSEKKMCDWIENNIFDFVKTVLDDEVIGYKREYYISKKAFAHNTQAIDFCIDTKLHGRVFMEVKNPRHITPEMTRSISQLLTYGALSDLTTKPADKLILVTSNTCPEVQLTIQKYKLPIEIVIANNDIIATWDKEWGMEWADQQL